MFKGWRWRYSTWNFRHEWQLLTLEDPSTTPKRQDEEELMNSLATKFEGLDGEGAGKAV